VSDTEEKIAPLSTARGQRTKQRTAHAAYRDKKLNEMNGQFAVVREGGKTLVISETIDPVLHRRVIERSSFTDIRNFYNNQQIAVSENSRGEPKYSPLGDWWLDHQDRRQYDGVVFDPGKETPGYFNMWRGFAVVPARGDWSLMKNHICQVICAANEDYYRYFMDWCASAVQRPGQPGEVAIVLRGRRGTGKGIVGREIGAMFGQHAIQIANPRHLTGNLTHICRMP
jgi:hypothetical protein